MPTKELIMDLAKLMAAAAWADGELSNVEVNALKDLLFGLEDIRGEDWKVLEMYLESPVTAAETEELLKRVIAGIRNAKDKRLVIERLRGLFEADGVVTAEETELLRQIEKAVDAADTGILSWFSKALGSAVRQRATHAKGTGLRESQFEDYVGNTVYYQLQRELERRSVRINVPEAELRKLCLAAGLLAHVAHVDREISEQELAVIGAIIAEDWRMAEPLPELLVRASCDRAVKGLDYVRLAQDFFERTDEDERQRFLVTLFKVANAAGKTSHEEIEEIRRVAKSLKLSHDDFIRAKLTIRREDRHGL